MRDSDWRKETQSQRQLMRMADGFPYIQLSPESPSGSPSSALNSLADWFPPNW